MQKTNKTKKHLDLYVQDLQNIFSSEMEKSLAYRRSVSIQIIFVLWMAF